MMHCDLADRGRDTSEALEQAAATGPTTVTNMASVQGDGEACPVKTIEANVLEALTSAIDQERARETEIVMSRNNSEGRNLKEHIKSLFMANTEEGTRTKQADWFLFCRLTYGKDIPKVHDWEWPLIKDAWLDFVLALRRQVSSYKRFQCVIGNVCEVANRYWSQNLECDPTSIDPRILFRTKHGKALHAVKR